jgi:hypothetical protein
MKGRETTRPVHLTDFNTHASPLRDLEYLLQDVQPTVLLYEHGIMINVPAPGRFAIHKCAISQRRPAALAAKSSKDLSQAEQLFQVLLENRPSDIALAYEAAIAHSEVFTKRFEDALDLVDDKIADDVRALKPKRA